MIYEIWLDAFSFWAFIFLLGVATGIWIGAAHGAQIERVVAWFRPEPKMAPETARAMLFAIQDQLGRPLPPMVEGQDGWIINGKLYKSDEQ